MKPRVRGVGPLGCGPRCFDTDLDGVCDDFDVCDGEDNDCDGTVPADEAELWTAPTKGTFEWGKVLGWWVGSRRVLEDSAAILCVGRGEYEAVSERFPRLPGP